MEQDRIVLCDTDVIIEFYRNNPRIISKLRSIGQENITVSTITAGELIYGALNKKELRQIKKDLDNIGVIAIDVNICGTFTDLMYEYVLSHKLSLPDGLIAATALSHGIELFTLNTKDYSFIKDLKLYP